MRDEQEGKQKARNEKRKGKEKKARRKEAGKRSVPGGSNGDTLGHFSSDPKRKEKRRRQEGKKRGNDKLECPHASRQPNARKRKGLFWGAPTESNAVR